MAGLILTGVSKSFGATRAVAAVSLTVEPGAFVAVLGPSGCGKSTLLRLIAGFEQLDAGRIELDGKMVSAPGRHVPAEHRGIGIVFQNYALWPHMNVGRNVAYPLEVRGLAPDERARRVSAALDRVGLAGFTERRPAELSGGQRQRVALARCLVMETSLVLLDEPLASLDAHLRASLQDAFGDFHRASGAGMLYITHDQAEAMALADRIAVIDQGRIAQLAAPKTLYREPETAMVAGFIGKGGLVAARVIAPAADGIVPVSLLGYRATVRCPADRPPHGAIQLCLRPDDLCLAARGQPGFVASVKRLRYQGGAVDVEITPEGQPEAQLLMTSPDGAGLTPGQQIRVAISDGWVVPEPASTESPAR